MSLDTTIRDSVRQASYPLGGARPAAPALSIESRSRAAAPEAFARAFAELPDRVRTGQFRAGLLTAQVWARFLEMAPPGHAEFWLAYDRDGLAVGRIGASRFRSYPDTGAIGFLELDLGRQDALAIGSGLLAAAEAWLRTTGATRAVGPLALSTWFPYRFRVDGNPRSFAWEPNNPPEYPRVLELAGYAPCEEYHSFGTAGLGGFAEKTREAYERALAAGYSFRPFDGARVMEREVPILYELSMKGFRENFLFEPITFEAFRELYVPIARKMDFSHAFFALDRSGREVGFFFGFLDGDCLILKSAAILEEARGAGLSNAMMHLAALPALKKGITTYVSALVRDGARSESYQKKGQSLWTHRYLLYQKPL